jgi:dolichol kinase
VTTAPLRAPRESWRRGLHLASGVLGPLAATLDPRVAAAAFAVLVAVAAAAETLRLASPRAGKRIGRLAGALFRPSEARSVSGAATLALGYALAWWLFPAAIAERAIVVAAVADPVAATVGSRVGGGGSKTWAGSLACACAAALVLLPGHLAAPAVAVAAIGAAVAERAPWHGSDNVAVPLVVAGLLWWLR